ncbi:13003_t:CDS:1, partial [Racocetra persica]
QLFKHSTIYNGPNLRKVQIRLECCLIVLPDIAKRYIFLISESSFV